MEYTAEELEDLATMRILRERLRAVASAKIAECEAMDPAKNWLDMNRQIKTIIAADRMVISLYSPPPRRRRSATKPKHHDEPLRPPPPHFPNGTSVRGEVSAKPTEGALWERSVSNAAIPQPSVISEPQAQPLPDMDSEAAELLAALTEKAREGISQATRRCAEWAGVWPDGERFNPEKSGWRKHTLTSVLSVPLDGDADGDIEPWLHDEILLRTNAIARHSARLAGQWFDATPFSESDPDYFAKSANYGTSIDRPAKGETKGPPRLPWWIVRKPPP